MQRTIKLLDQLIVKYETNLGVPHRSATWEVQAAPAADPASLFAKLDIRVGNITEIWKHPESTKLWCEKIDIGQDAPREVGTGLQQHRTKEEMLGLVLVVSNLPPKGLAGFSSNGMILCVTKGDTIFPLRPPQGSVVGERVGLQQALGQGNYLPVLPPTDAVWQEVLPHLHTSAAGEACCGDLKFVTSAGVVTSPLADARIS